MACLGVLPFGASLVFGIWDLGFRVRDLGSGIETEEHSTILWGRSARGDIMEERIQGGILIVDDNDDFRTYVAELVSSIGGTVQEAPDAATALECVAKSQPDLILLDVEMPGMDGLTCCRTLKANPLTRLIPIVIITSLSDPDDRVKGIEAGADDFLSKPFRVAELVARIGSLLRVKKLNESLESAENVILTLARAIEAKDKFTEGHTERVAAYAVGLGQAAGCSADELTGLRLGGILHDIGKISVPDYILNKPGELTAEEWEIVKCHPMTGFRICSPMRTLVHALPCIRWHHERPNGTGYPDALRLSAIPRSALITSIADVYDALTSTRPYKEAVPQGKALELLQEEVRMGQLDAELVKLFIQHHDGFKFQVSSFKFEEGHVQRET